MSDDRAVLRIGEVSRRTGVAVPTLRAWERRYGLLEPARTEGGHRLYSQADVERVRAMSRLLDDGWSAAAAAREVLRTPATVTPLRTVESSGPATASERLIAQLRAAIESFDSQAADGAVDDVFARLEVPRALDEVLLPVLRTVGDGWQEDPRVIAREHFASNTLRPRLQRLLGTAPRGAARSCLAAAPEGEDHDLGVLAAAAVAADAGWRVHYLGARMPTPALERSVAELRPDLVLIGSLNRERANAFLDAPPAIGATPIVLGGVGFQPQDAARLPTAVVHQGTISELPATLARALTRRAGAIG
jgi:MerR family transcriptional regulator, light-induced transcriptional regulator